MSDRYTGSRIRNLESLRFVTGRGQYIDDLKLPGMVSAHFLRSTHAHARVDSIELDPASKIPGVLGIWSGRDLASEIKSLLPILESATYLASARPALAFDHVRFAGEAVAVIVAADRYIAEDAADSIHVEYSLLDPVTDLNNGGPELHDGTNGNVLYEVEIEAGNTEQAFREADVRIVRTFEHPRCTGLAIENRGVVAYCDRRGVLTLWSSTQIPHLVRKALAACLDFPEHKIRVMAPDVGGGFGVKMHVFPEELVIAWLALKLQRPVKWIEDRRENLMASMHARDHVLHAEISARRDGTITALKVQDLCDAGAYSAYPVTCGLEPLTCGGTLPGPYKIANYSFRGKSIATDKCPVGAIRGVGFVLGTLVTEILIEEVARQLSMDSAEIRRRNFIAPGQFPYQSAGGMVYDSGDYGSALEHALGLAEYAKWRERQRELRAQGRYIGLGLSSFIEPTGMGRKVFRKRGTGSVPGFDSATIKVDPSGTVRAFLSTPSQGQGQETTFGQLLADEMGLPLEDISVSLADTDVCPSGSGTFASRSIVSAGSALVLAAKDMRRRLLCVAGFLLRRSPDTLDIRRGNIFVGDEGECALSLAELAQRINAPLDDFPPNANIDLEVTRSFSPDGAAVSYGTQIAIVEVDSETGIVTLLRYVVAEDCGTVVNPAIVDGQVRGGIMQGIGSALLEKIVYDSDGQVLTASLMDYLVPGSTEAVPIEIEHLVTRSPLTPTGSKGVGESGTIAAPAAIANAVSDALAPFHVSFTKLPIMPQDIVEAIRRSSTARGARSSEVSFS